VRRCPHTDETLLGRRGVGSLPETDLCVAKALLLAVVVSREARAVGGA
jgi:hypothetical protein